ncbi:MAG TPA: glycosyltransferase family 1 protein [Gammaproteobacteria bacterium]|nr:glycosyltransferase family 1 protein [Gammaproteobacteria bacterium]
MSPSTPKTIAYIATSAGDWGGTSRYLFVMLRQLNRERFAPLVLFPAQGPMLPEMARRGIRHRIWPEHEPHGKLAYARDVVRCLTLLRREKVDLLYVNHVGYWRPAEMLAARLLGLPIVTHAHRVVKQAPPYLRFSTLLLTNSHYTATASVATPMPRRVIHCPVDVARFDGARDIRAELGLSADDIVVGFLGQIRRIKGIDTFIELARRIPDPRVRFVIAGACRDPAKFPGSYTEAQLRAAIAFDPRLRYVGYRGDVENLYHSADVIVMPSQWDEPFGLITIEAGASYKPVVASRSGGIPEIIEHGENGFLVDRFDTAAFAEYTRRLVADPTLSQRMGQNARRVVEARFVNKPAQDLEAVLDELLADGHRV